MPICKYRRHDVFYEFPEQGGTGPVVAFINGITQRTTHWASFVEAFKRHGIRTLTYDQLGQGSSDKPVLDYDFEENPDILVALLDHCGVDKAYVAGISFGGAIALKFGIKYPERCAGLVAMSAFSELDGRLVQQGVAMYEGLVRVGFEYLVDWLLPINFSSRMLEGLGDSVRNVRRTSANVNDLYSIQNLIESIRTMPKEGFTKDLGAITCPTLILNGEYDYLTPRWSHELLRKNIASSRLMIIQHAFHAFTIEFPALSERIIREFVQSVEDGSWVGDRSVWIADDDATAPEVAFPCVGDHTRAIPIFARPADVPAPTARPAAKKTRGKAKPAPAKKKQAR